MRPPILVATRVRAGSGQLVPRRRSARVGRQRGTSVGGAHPLPVLGVGKVQADVNGDGFADLVVGVSVAHEDEPSTGAVAVLYGTADGLSTDGQQTVNPSDLPGIGPDSTPFTPGVIVAGDFNGDGYSDLAIADQRGDVGRTRQAGVVYVVPGSADGLVTAAAKVWSQDSPGVGGSPETGDSFGNSLAAADFGGGPEIDLAVGVRGELRGSDRLRASGMVQVLYGSPAGLTGSGSQHFTQDTAHVPGHAEEGDFFGDSLAAGNFDGKYKADLAIGSPFEDIGNDVDAGGVTVLYSSGTVLSGRGSQSWSQDRRRGSWTGPIPRRVRVRAGGRQLLRRRAG